MTAKPPAAPLSNVAPAPWSTWSAGERESFFEAIARHRQAAWRVTLASGTANTVVAVIVATLMAPLFYGTLALALDVINIAVPAPNLIASIMSALGPAMDAPETISVGRWLQLLVFAAIPGLIWMGVVVLSLRRMLRLSASFDAGEMAARAPNVTVLAEQQFGNVIGEMAIAANIPPPRVLIVDRPVQNAAVFGRDEQHATVVISQGLLERLDRAEMQGIAAHLIGSIANADMGIGLRAAVTISLFSLVAYLGTVLVKGTGAFRKLARILRAAVMPTAAGARELAMELADPFADTDPPESKPESPVPSSGPQTPWEKVRPFLWLPLAGPLVMSGFFGGVVSLFVLGPLLALAWRQRKYMADATAVRLTRDPNTLSEALQKMSAAGDGVAFAPWTAHLSVVQLGHSQSKLMGGGAVPMFPSLERRLRALGKLGAQMTTAPRKMPLRVVLIIGPLFAIVAVLVAIMLPLMVWLSLALTMLMTALPLGIVHALLRWIGH